MLKKIKAIAALLLIVCLFLPLSQCTQPPLPTDKNQSDVIYDLYVVQRESDAQWKYFPAIPFVLPLLMVLFNFGVKHEKLRYELLDLILGMCAVGVVLLHVFVAKLVTGGYLAMAAAGTYMLASLLESAKTIKLRYLNRS